MSQHISSANCMGCALRSKPNEGVLGHTNCSEHRPCTGRKYWEPEDCLQCTQLHDHLRYMTSSAVQLRLTEVRTMLINVQTKLRLENNDRIWKYEPIFSDFFSDYMHLDPGSPDNSEYQLDEDDAEATGENYETSHNEALFDGQIDNAGEQVFHERLSRDPVCNYEYCAFPIGNTHCDNPVHIKPYFKCVQVIPSNHRTNTSPMTQNNFKRQRSPSPASLPIPPAMSPTNNHSGTQSYHSVALPATVDVSGVTPLSGFKLPLVKAPADYCREARKTYWTFTKEIHTRKGTNRIDIVEMDPTKTFIVTNVYTVEYKPGDSEQFSIIEDLPSSKSPYIRPQTAGVTFASAHALQTSTSNIKKSGSDKNYLDSDISSTSGLSQVQNILHDLDNACANKATGLMEDHLLALFAKDDPKEAFDAINYVNFKDGWTLTNGGYEKFAKDEDLKTGNMKDYLLTHLPEIKANKQLLTKENETRQAMLHAFSTLHYQELLTNKLELMSDEHKSLYGLTPEVSKGICRMQLSQLKYFISRWMIAKMRVRKDILKDNDGTTTQLNINFLLQQSLWDPDIFPKDSFSQLRERCGVLHVAPLIGLSKPITNNNNPNGNNNNITNNGGNNSNNNNGNGYTNAYKKQKTNYQGQRRNNPSYGYGASPNPNKRGGQQSRPYNKKQYNSANKSDTNIYKRQSSQRGNRGNTRKGKTFRGGEEPK